MAYNASNFNDYITGNSKIWLNYIIFWYRTLRKGKLRTKNASIYVYSREIPPLILPTLPTLFVIKYYRNYGKGRK